VEIEADLRRESVRTGDRDGQPGDRERMAEMHGDEDGLENEMSFSQMVLRITLK
jgi:hypothetical protein